MAGSGSQPLLDVSIEVTGVPSTGSLAAARKDDDQPSAVLESSPAEVANSETLGPPQPTNLQRWSHWLWSNIESLVRNRSTPGFLCSFILHTSLFVGLAIWTVAGPGRGGMSVGILESPVLEPAEAETEMIDPLIAAGSITEDARASAEAASLQAPAGPQTVMSGAVGEALSSVTHATDLGDGTAAPRAQTAAGQLAEAMSSSMNATLAPTGVEGRAPESRNRLAMERGGSGESEAAVEMALEWLVAHQKGDGHWSLEHATPKCGPDCTHEGSPERYDPAATGLGLLAFLGAGYTHRGGKHADTVKRGVYYLLQIMKRTDRGGSFEFDSQQGMYNQGIATFALCEAYQLSKDESLRDPCQQAINYIVSAQDDRGGGWGYLPDRPGDLTITGWQTMALKSADAAGLYIPATTVVRIDEFLDSQGDKDKTFYGYGAPAPKNETCTAIGLLLRMFRGWPHSDPRVLTAATYLERQGVSSHDIYRNYYVTLLLFHVGGRTFQEWNPQMRDSLIKTQSQSGHSRGSWYFEDRWGEVGGRHYTTAMAAMTLEVYYRFSPLYLNSEKPFEF